MEQNGHATRSQLINKLADLIERDDLFAIQQRLPAFDLWQRAKVTVAPEQIERAIDQLREQKSLATRSREKVFSAVAAKGISLPLLLQGVLRHLEGVALD